MPIIRWIITEENIAYRYYKLKDQVHHKRMNPADLMIGKYIYVSSLEDRKKTSERAIIRSIGLLLLFLSNYFDHSSSLICCNFSPTKYSKTFLIKNRRNI